MDTFQDEHITEMNLLHKINTSLIFLYEIGLFISHTVLGIVVNFTQKKKIRKLGKVIKTKWTLIALAFLLNVILIVLCYALPPMPVSFMTANLICLIVEIPVVMTLIAELYYMDVIAQGKWKLTIYKIWRQCMWLALSGVVVSKLVCTVSGGSSDPLYLGMDVSEASNFSYSTRIGLLFLQSICIFCDFIVISTCWAFKDKFSTSFFCLASVVGLVLGIVKIYLCVKNIPGMHVAFSLLFFFVVGEALLMAGTFLVFCVIIVLVYQNRLSKVMKKLINIVNIYYSALIVLELIKLPTSIYWSIKHSELIFQGLAILNCITVIVEVAVLVGAKLVCISPTPDLLVEKFDLKQLKSNQKEAFARLINSNSRANPGISGNEILSLMEAYCSSSLPEVEFIALRVYKPVENEDSVSDLSYEKIQSWKNLDEESNIFGNEMDINVPDEVLKLIKPMSKNQRKILAKKAKAVKKGKESVTFPLNEIKTEIDFEEEKRFYAKLMSTEAIILVTKIIDYDLTTSVDSKLLNILGKMFGKRSIFKLLCINFGLLGFHWPFRRSTFYCSSTKHPVARSAAVMRAVTRWNKSLPRRERMSVLLDPTYAGDNSSKAIHYGGWISTMLPSSNIIDLRPHKNKTVSEYFKAVKYRSQSETFLSAGGEIIEDCDFSTESCDSAISLWQNISTQEENGYSSYLANPDSNFIQVIGTTANENSKRSLLFLQVDGVLIASCILFRLGDTITSDIQGLDHENGRTYKAYFVMMEAVIKIAISEGKNFVDFGPTTDKPKRDIGCQSVPLVGGLSSSSSMLSPFVRLAAKKVKV